MPLFYTVTRRERRTEEGPYGLRTIEETITEQEPLEAFDEWAMFSAAGNRALKEIAEKALAKMEKLVEAGEITTPKAREILVSYLVGWKKACRKKSTSEASDTAVREVVGDFHDRLALASGCFMECDVYDLWEENRDEAWRQFERARKK